MAANLLAYVGFCWPGGSRFATLQLIVHLPRASQKAALSHHWRKFRTQWRMSILRSLRGATRASRLG